MRFNIVLLISLFVISDRPLAAKVNGFAESQREREGFEIVLVVMPKGDPVNGRKAFQKMSCQSCHRVSNDPFMPGPDEKSAPDLDYKKTGSSGGYEVTSILSPSHIVAFNFRTNNQKKSSMPDLTESMSVRELIDILAYLRSTRSDY